MSRCDECDPSLGCFSAQEECRKPSARTARPEPPNLIVRIESRGAFEIRQTDGGDVEAWTEMDDGYRDHYCDFDDDEGTAVEELADEIMRQRGRILQLEAEIRLTRPVWYAAQAWWHGCVPETELEIAVDAVDEAINDGFEFLPLTPPASGGTVAALDPPEEQW